MSNFWEPNKGKNPVPGGKVDVLLANGNTATNVPSNDLTWAFRNIVSDIVAYRIVETRLKPGDLVAYKNDFRYFGKVTGVAEDFVTVEWCFYDYCSSTNPDNISLSLQKMDESVLIKVNVKVVSIE